MKKNLRWSILFVAAFVCLLIPVMAQRAAAATEYRNLWIGNTRVTSANSGDILGDGGSARYNSSTKTLTLNNPTINDYYSENGAQIYAKGIDLIVTGTANLKSDNPDVGAIYVSRDSEGKGSLTIENAAITAEGKEDGFGIMVFGNLSITNSTVTTAGPVNYGIRVYDADITVSGEKTSVTAAGNIYGLSAEGGNIVIQSGTVEAVGGNAALGSEPDLSSYYAWNRTVTVNKVTKADGASKWNESDKLGGESSFKYVKIVPRIEYGLYVGNTQVTSENLSGTGWSYEPESKTKGTLTLMGDPISGHSSAHWGQIYADGIDLTVTGTATLDTNYDNGTALYVQKDYQGLGGTLTIRDANITANGRSTCIYASEALTISNSTVNATTADPASGHSYYGIQVLGPLTVSDSTVTASGDENGIYIENGSIVISGSKSYVDATGKDAVYVKSGDLTVAAGTVTAEAVSYKYEGYNGTITVPAGSSVYAEGKVTVSGGKLTAWGGEGKGIYSEGDVEISAGTVKAKGFDGIVSTRYINTSGGKVTAEGTGGYGLSAEKEINITDGNVTAIGFGKALNRVPYIEYGLIVWVNKTASESGAKEWDGPAEDGKLGGEESPFLYVKIGTPPVKYPITVVGGTAYGDLFGEGDPITTAEEEQFVTIMADPVEGKYVTEWKSDVPLGAGENYLKGHAAWITMPASAVTMTPVYANQMPYVIDLSESDSVYVDSEAWYFLLDKYHPEVTMISADNCSFPCDLDGDGNNDIELYDDVFNLGDQEYQVKKLDTANIEKKYEIKEKSVYQYYPVTVLFSVTKYPVWVDNVQVTEENMTDILGNGTAAYDPGDKMLTLKNAVITKEYTYGGGIYSDDGGLKITGTGTVSSDDMSIAVYLNEGNLTVEKANLTLKGKTYGISVYYNGSITIADSTVNASGSDYYGIISPKSLTITGSKTNVTATGGQDGIWAPEDIWIKGGTVSGSGTNRDGIHANGTIQISGGDVTGTGKEIGIHSGAFLEEKKIEITGGKVTADGSTRAIWADSGITIAATHEITAPTGGHLSESAKTVCDTEGYHATHVVITPKHVHDWGTPTYTWTADYSKVTATRVCKTDSTHKETETVTTTSKVTTPATCEAKGKTTYTAIFTNTAFAKQTKAVENIPALGHEWDTGVVTKQPTVTQTGIMTYTCKRCGKTKTAVIPKLTVLRGDLNSDGSVNQKDLAMLSKYMRNSTLYPLNETAMAAADINGDGNVNQKDLAILSKYMRNPTAYPLP